ncbi:MAG: hydantoinase/oxoprolinase family protein [Nitriliruptorales bacterium]|nr:hydantoinase/oxoprolinase family protein [Nitriliruptorales bacterium]
MERMQGQRERVGGVDVGGTFTDVVLVAPGEAPRAVKVPTTPEDQGEGVVAGLREAAPAAVPLVAHGTTTATNAVLERAVARTVLVVTEGFRDLLIIGRQDRPALYDLTRVRPTPLVPPDLVVTVAERTGPDGQPIVSLTDGEVTRVVDEVVARRPESVAVSLLFSFAGPAHEQRLGAALRKRLAQSAGADVPVTCSSDVLPEFREFERTSTAVLNAAVAPVMGRYLDGLDARLPASTITVMTSAGGTATLARAAQEPVHTLLSGPAAGVVAAGRVAAGAGFADAVALDMGGTSTDVCLIRDGRPEVALEAEIAGLPFRTPAVAIHTVGAGGGSIAAIDTGGALRVGPRSAGARPGPACYGFGGAEPTVTDAHCALGHLDPARELGGGLRLDARAARTAIDTLGPGAGGAEGILTVVRATMARALRRVTTERGVDPGTLALVAYGGAGPLSATALARDLGCATVVIPPAPGVLSALGLLLAPARYEVSRTVLGDDPTTMEATWEGLAHLAAEQLTAQRPGGPVTVTRVADVRYAGQSHELRVAVDKVEEVEKAFAAAHHEAYGYAMPGEPVEVATLRAVAEGPPSLDAPPARWDLGASRPERRRIIGLGGGSGGQVEARVLDRAALRSGDRIAGPALLEQSDTTTLLAPEDVAECDDAGNLVVRLA